MDLTEWLLSIFNDCNATVSTKLSGAPTVYEQWLDHSLIDHLSHYETPRIFPSGYAVSLHVRFAGGYSRYWSPWSERGEVADIGFVVRFVRAGRLEFSKVCLLQSKRLYSRETQEGNMNVPTWPAGAAVTLGRPRTFRFSEDCRYEALRVGEAQWHHVRSFEEDERHNGGFPVYYLFYNPLNLPLTVHSPLRPSEVVGVTASWGAGLCPHGRCARR